MSIVDTLKGVLRPPSEYRKNVSSSSEEISEAIREGKERIEKARASLAVDFVFGAKPDYSQEELRDGYKIALGLAHQMEGSIRVKVTEALVSSYKPSDIIKRVDALQRKNIIAPAEIEALLEALKVEALTVVANVPKPGDAKSDQVASNLIKQFIKGINDSLQGKDSPSPVAHR